MIHLMIEDAEDIFELAVMTEDRTDEEQKALLRMAEQLDRISLSETPYVEWAMESRGKET